MSEKLEAAKHYLSSGFPVIPFKLAPPPNWKPSAQRNEDGTQKKDKNGNDLWEPWKPLPLVKDWKRYMDIAPTLEQVEAWWREMPDADIAIVTGQVSGVTVLDTEKGADLSLFGLTSSTTPSVVSGGEGRHFYFAYTPEVTNAVKFAPLHDIRNNGGLIFAPPSGHRSGGTYRWDVPLDRSKLLPFPRSIIEAVNSKGRGSGERKDWGAILGGSIGEGSRNDTATSVIGKLLRRFPVKEWEDTAWPLLMAWNEQVSSPPLPMGELRSVFVSIARSEERRSAVGASLGQPTLTREGKNFIVHVPIKDGFAVFSYTDAIAMRGDITANVRVHVEIEGEPIRQFEQTLSVLSGSSRSSYVTQLKDSYGKDHRWSLLLSEACSLFAKEYRKAAAENLKDASQIVPAKMEHLMFPFIEDGSANVLFAKGGVGKTTLALRMALALACGGEFLGVRGSKDVKTLFVDYENTESSFRRSIDKLRNGVDGFKDEHYKSLLYLNTDGQSINDMRHTIKDMVAKNGVGLIIIDSAAPACGGPPEDAATATRFFLALREIGCTTLIIGHEAKADDGKFTFGSVFFTNLARNIWNLKADDNQQGYTRRLRLTHKKNNNGPLSPAIGYVMRDGIKGIAFEPCELNDGELPARKKVVEALMSADELTPSDIAKITFIKAKTVSNILQELKENGSVMAGTKYGRWKLASRERASISSERCTS